MSTLTRIVSVCVRVCLRLFTYAYLSPHSKITQRGGNEEGEREREGRRIGVSRIVARSFRAWQAGRKLYRLIDAKDVHNVQLGAERGGLRWQEKTTKQQHTHAHIYRYTQV